MPEQFLHGVEVVEIDGGPRPIRTLKSSVIGIVGTAPDADASTFPLNTPVLVAGNRREAAKLDTVGDGAGTLPAALDGILDQSGAMVVVVRVDEGADDAATMTNVVGGVDEATGQYMGVQALRASASVLGFTPRVLLAPGFTHQRAEDADNPGTFFKNPVGAELEGIAERLRAVVIVDGPNTNDTDAIAAMGDFGTARVFMVDPWVKVYRDGEYVAEPASARVAGMIARSDNDRGFWWSPSNQQVMGISGTARPVDFTLGDVNCRANMLNEKNVATIINEGGYRLWGNRTGCTDPKWSFLSVRRTADMINESILAAHLWAVDRNITKTYVDDVVEGVNAYLRHLEAVGAILGGTCWADPELNTPDQVQQGKVYFDFDFTPPYPAEHVTFRSHLVNDYIEEVFN
ncbi:phage tail sheath C-terminal domain-containing protein [Desulfobaculum sp.]